MNLLVDARTRRILFLLMGVLITLSIHRLGCASSCDPSLGSSGISPEQLERRHETSGPIMGTTYAVVAFTDAPLSDEEKDTFDQAVRETLEEVNTLMSTYRDDSEVSRFNTAVNTTAVPISQPTYEVLHLAQRVSRDTDGAFDITVGPLVTAWGFGAEPDPRPPTQEETRTLRAYVGYRGLHLTDSPPTVRKSDPRTRVDLSAVAKGYSVDRVVARLEELGYANFLVEVGGELAARGHRFDSTPWRVGVERPDTANRAVYRVVPLRNRAMATSGDYRIFRTLEEGRVSHIIDPRSGNPVGHSLTSVSVIHESAAMADALATALSVMGPEEGLAWVEAHDIVALFISRRSDSSLEPVESSAYARYMASE